MNSMEEEKQEKSQLKIYMKKNQLNKKKFLLNKLPVSKMKMKLLKS
jgi:hypothetical protein